MINGTRGQRSLWWEALRLWDSELLPSPFSSTGRPEDQCDVFNILDTINKHGEHVFMRHFPDSHNENILAIPVKPLGTRTKQSKPQQNWPERLDKPRKLAAI